MSGVEKLDFDPYELLEVGEESQEKELVKAFRKKALKWHPDKNPDRKEYAQEMFLKVSKAFEILTDASVKAAYDRLKKARRAARERNKHLDARRKKFKEQLESREAGVQVQKDEEVLAAKRLQREIERLRKEGSKLLQKEKEEIEREIQEQSKKESRLTPECSTAGGGWSGSPPRLRIRWRAEKNDPDNGGYNEELLKSLFSKYGDVVVLVVSCKRKGSALVEFTSTDTAVLAWKLEKGVPENPLTLSWLSGKPQPTTEHQEKWKGENGHSADDGGTTVSGNSGSDETGEASSVGGGFEVDGGGLSSGRDFESVVLMKLRQAEERKKLIQQLQKQDQEEDVVLE